MNSNKGKSNPIAPLVAGVVVGGAAVAAAMTFRDKKNREKVMDKMGEVKDKAKEYIKEVKQNPTVKKGKEEIDEMAKEAKQKLNK